jgi:Family of unknown function (DUF5996)
MNNLYDFTLSLNNNPWSALPLVTWKETYDTLHRWTQIVGKIRLACAPLGNHWRSNTQFPTANRLLNNFQKEEIIKYQNLNSYRK